jgi:hypothetical protein
VFVNGAWCRSMTDGAKLGSLLLGREVRVWEVQRALKGAPEINGLHITEELPEKRHKPDAPEKRSGGPLLKYPSGGRPLERGLPERRT